MVPIVLVLTVRHERAARPRRTKFGRYMYAIGGNAEAARRAGVNLSRIRVLAFAMCGLVMAGVTGILYASFLGSISNNIAGGQYVLYSVAGAVIGGVSLFGGRGRIAGAVLGGFVVAVIYNGVDPARARRGRPVHLDRRRAARRGHPGRAGPPGLHGHLSPAAAEPGRDHQGATPGWPASRPESGGTGTRHGTLVRAGKRVLRGR